MERTRRRRLDQLLVDRGLAETRSRAQALLLAGRVRVGAGDAARRDLKAGDLVGGEVPLSLDAGPDHASRGGDKLAAVLGPLAVDPAGRICLDVGASTGGFTDVLLRRGALRVHAIDVGRGQLHQRLARDARVVVHDRTNARALSPATIGEAASLATIDVSFISLRLVVGPVASCLAEEGGTIVALVKPQFEAGRALVRDGVVRDAAVHRAVVEEIASHASDLGLRTVAVETSPLVGPAGNREFFLRLDVPERWVAPRPSADGDGAEAAGGIGTRREPVGDSLHVRIAEVTAG